MATARPKQARRRTGAASRTRPRAGAAATKVKPKAPASRHRRELGAIACLAVAVFLAFVLYLGWDGGSLGRWLGDAARWLGRASSPSRCRCCSASPPTCSWSERRTGRAVA